MPFLCHDLRFSENLWNILWHISWNFLFFERVKLEKYTSSFYLWNFLLCAIMSILCTQLVLFHVTTLLTCFILEYCLEGYYIISVITVNGKQPGVCIIIFYFSYISNFDLCVKKRQQSGLMGQHWHRCYSQGQRRQLLRGTPTSSAAMPPIGDGTSR